MHFSFLVQVGHQVLDPGTNWFSIIPMTPLVSARAGALRVLSPNSTLPLPSTALPLSRASSALQFASALDPCVANVSRATPALGVGLLERAPTQISSVLNAAAIGSVDNVGASQQENDAAESVSHAIRHSTGLQVEPHVQLWESNFWSQLPDIARCVSESTFVAIDCEMTGLWARGGGPSRLEDYNTRYQQVKDSAEKFALIQFGLSCFSPRDPSSPGGEGWVARTFNVTLFPSSGPSSGGLNPMFTCSASSIEFLSQQGFDFSSWVRDGVRYVPLQQRLLLMAQFEAAQVATAAGAAAAAGGESGEDEVSQGDGVAGGEQGNGAAPGQRPPPNTAQASIRVRRQPESGTISFTGSLASDERVTAVATAVRIIEACSGGEGGESGGEAQQLRWLEARTAILKWLAGEEVQAWLPAAKASEAKVLQALIHMELMSRPDIPPFTINIINPDATIPGGAPPPPPLQAPLIPHTSPKAGTAPCWGVRLSRQPPRSPQMRVASKGAHVRRAAIHRTAGPALLLEMLRDAGKPVVLHNGTLDLALILAQMRGSPLPDTWDGYKTLVGRWFPGGVYDTKYLASLVNTTSSSSSSSSTSSQTPPAGAVGGVGGGSENSRAPFTGMHAPATSDLGVGVGAGHGQTPNAVPTNTVITSGSASPQLHELPLQELFIWSAPDLISTTNHHDLDGNMGDDQFPLSLLPSEAGLDDHLLQPSSPTSTSSAVHAAHAVHPPTPHATQSGYQQAAAMLLQGANHNHQLQPPSPREDLSPAGKSNSNGSTLSPSSPTQQSNLALAGLGLPTHEAGFDALMTGAVFAALIEALRPAPTAITASVQGGSSPAPRRTYAQGAKGGSAVQPATAAVPSAMIIEPPLHHLVPHAMRIHGRREVPYYNLAGPDPVPSVPGVYILSGIPSRVTWFDVSKKWQAAGLGPVRVHMFGSNPGYWGATGGLGSGGKGHTSGHTSGSSQNQQGSRPPKGGAGRGPGQGQDGSAGLGVPVCLVEMLRPDLAGRVMESVWRMDRSWTVTPLTGWRGPRGEWVEGQS